MPTNGDEGSTLLREQLASFTNFVDGLSQKEVASRLHLSQVQPQMILLCFHLSLVVYNLNVTLCEVSKALKTVNGKGDKENLRQIMTDTTATVSNLRKFSEKLNKRFLLFRLMF